MFRRSTAGTASRFRATCYTSETIIQPASQPTVMASVPPPTSSDESRTAQDVPGVVDQLITDATTPTAAYGPPPTPT
jgi:hypothetical protein